MKQRRPIHISWFIAWISLAIIAGIGCSALLPFVTLQAWLVYSISLPLLIIAVIKRSRPIIGCVIVAGLLLGVWRGGNEQRALIVYSQYVGKIVTMQGTVSDDTSYGPRGDQRIMLKDVVIDGEHVHGIVWIGADDASTIRRGDILTVNGKLGSGFSSIAASMFHARVQRIVRPEPGDIGVRVRDWFADGIRRAIPEPEASLASGFLVGQRSTLPEDLDAQLKMTGLTHAVVASGYNLTILVSFARQLLAGMSKYLATLAGAGMIAGFMMMSGLSPSMSRAGLVTSLSLAAWYYGRKIHPVVLLPFAAAVTAIIHPAYVWGDIGWYLSFTSFAGVIILAPLLQQYFWGDQHHVGLMRQTLIDTMSAQIATLPIMIFAFGHYSPYALLANLFVLPLIPLTMLLTFFAGVAGLIVPGIAHLFGLSASLILHYMTAVISHIANFPGAQGDMTISVFVVAVSYLLLTIILYVLWRVTRHDFRQDTPVAVPENEPNLKNSYIV